MRRRKIPDKYKRKSRVLTVLVNGKVRTMRVPSEKSVAALRSYAQYGRVVLT